ncbi:MAG TPA: exopolyphosphatase, partial [Mucilaginibacter sp.]
LMECFHHTDPIPPASIEALNLYLENCLPDLFKAVEQIPVSNLIGSSGAFETFAALIDNSFDLKKTKTYYFENDDLTRITDQMIRSNHAEREANKSIIPVRVDMIVVASLITRYIMQKLNLNKVALCTYSLKEGVLAEMMA